ncbi:MAG: LysM peptidoglycan-binding domain-containing protein [Opitutales bacterium]|nr:LysM peptidoglycan-binding domain-containing protein [Opitutales bacterium]
MSFSFSRFLPSLTRQAFLVALLTGTGLSAPGLLADQNADFVERLSPERQNQLLSFDLFENASLREIAARTQEETLRPLIEEILSVDSLSIGVREVDENDRAEIHHLLLDHLNKLEPYGVEYVGSLTGIAAVPVSVDRRLDPDEREAPSALTIGEEQITVHPLWPNGPMPSLAPKEGITGKLVDIGSGRWSDLNGKDLRGNIAVMSFRGGNNFERAFYLGARAILIVEDNNVDMENAERLFRHTPLPYPRFYLPRAEGQALLEQINQSENPIEATLNGGQVIENRPIESIFAFLPPDEERTLEVGEDTHLRLIADQFGVSTRDLLRANDKTSPNVTEGDEIIIPGRTDIFTIPEGDLISRLANRYGTTPDDFREANDWDEGQTLQPGDSYLVPNREDPFVITVNIDTVSVVPDLPHGAHQAKNIAFALNTMEHLATSENSWRRRGILFAFMDGDTQGGIASRKLAEHYQLYHNRLRTAHGEDLAAEIENYEGAMAFFDPDRSIQDMDREYAMWFANDWIVPRLEDVRIDIGEKRVALINELLEMPDPDPGPGEIRHPDLEKMSPAEIEALREERRELRQRQAYQENRRDRLQELRLQTIEQRRLSFQDRLESFHDIITENPDTNFPDRIADAMKGESFAALFGETDMTFESLKERFLVEMEEEKEAQAYLLNNLDLAEKLYPILHPADEEDPRLGWFLDLSSDSRTIGLPALDSSDFRGRLPGDGANHGRDLENSFQYALSLGHIRAGWEEQWSFYRREDSLDFPVLPARQAPIYGDFWAALRVGVLPMGNFNDRLSRLDTPHDTLENINFENFSIVARNALFLMQLGAESPTDSSGPSRMSRPRFTRIGGQTVEASIRSALDAEDPVGGTIVHYPGIRTQEERNNHNTNAYRGTRRSFQRVSMLNGRYRVPLENIGFSNMMNHIYAYHLNRDRAIFDKIATQGLLGAATEAQTPAFQMIEGREAEKKIILVDVAPLVFFAGSEPHDYQILGSGNHDLRVLEAVTRGNPREYALENPVRHFAELETLGNIIYMNEGGRASILYQRTGQNMFMLVGRLVEDERFGGTRRGEGIRIGPTDDGEENTFYPFTAMRVAEQMLDLAIDRQDTYADFGIRSQSIARAIARSQEKLNEAYAFYEEKEWQKAEGAARESWGMLVKFYPRILGLGREAVFSVIMIMAILLPASYFLEKLLIGSKAIIAQIFGTSTLFALGTVFLWLFHPAFSIAVSPFIVVISFTMILMSIIVLTICYQRFETLVRRARIAGGEVEGEEISLVSSLGTALSMGVSNLKKRPSRTFLTSLTVTVLTFSIVAFVSVTGEETVSERSVSLDHNVEGRTIEAMEPAFEGMLFRSFNWQSLTSSFVDAVETEFGSHLPTTTRAWYIEREGGNNAAVEGANQVEIRLGDRQHISTGIMVFEPNETEFSGLHRAVSNAEWFRPAQWEEGIAPDRNVIILPDNAAQRLGITEEHIFDENGQRRPVGELPSVIMQNQQWSVIGILDVEKANRIRDVNGRSLAMVDYVRSNMTGNAPGELINEDPVSYHFDWERLVIVPMAARTDVNARLRSVVVQFQEDTDVEQIYHDVALRLNRPFFAHHDENLSFITTRTQRDIGGIAKIIVPIILCVLIVLNTMMGTVDERRGEVGMLGAVGLSPKQISFLLLSESAVYSVIGILFGMFIGLLFANSIPFFNEVLGVAFLSELSFNFTSVISMGLALGTGVIVMIATLIPAKRAATLAAPSGMSNWELPEPADDKNIYFELPFTLTRGNAVGMSAFFRQFLLNHTDASSEDFTCRDIRLENRVTEEGGPALRIESSMWLSPYDLDVAQHFIMDIVPTKNPGVYAVELILERTSGAEDAWIRINYRFLNNVRHQFLLWRNLSPEERNNFIKRGAELLQDD